MNESEDEAKRRSSKQEVRDTQKVIKDEQAQMVIKSGFVFRKKGIVSNNKRRLILTNQPRLYYTTEAGDYKGDIVLT